MHTIMKTVSVHLSTLQSTMILPIYQQAESNKLRCSNHLTFQTTNIRSQGPQSGSTAGFPHWLWLGGVTPRGRWWSMGPKTANKQLPLLNCRRQIPSEPEANLPATINSSNKDFDVDSRVDQQKKKTFQLLSRVRHYCKRGSITRKTH